MEQEAKMAQAIAETLEKSLPGVISTVVDEKVAEATKGFSTSMEDLSKQVADVHTSLKASNGSEQKARVERIGKFWKAFARQDMAEVKTLSEGVDADGGYLVPVEFHAEVIRVANESGLARRLCRIIPMGTDTKNVTALSGSVTTYVVGEDSAVTASSPTFGSKVLTARKFGALVHATQELIDDSQSDEAVMTLVANLVAESLAELEDAQVLAGSGSGSNMRGALNLTSANIVTMGSTKTSFDDITYANLIDLKNSVNIKYKRGKKARFFMSQDVFGYIEKLVDTTGHPIVRESVVTPDTYTLLGYPVELSDAMPDTSDDAVSTKFIVFGDLQYFAFGDRQKISAEEGYISGNFEKSVKSLRVIERVAGVGLIDTAFGVLKTAAA